MYVDIVSSVRSPDMVVSDNHRHHPTLQDFGVNMPSGIIRAAQRLGSSSQWQETAEESVAGQGARFGTSSTQEISNRKSYWRRGLAETAIHTGGCVVSKYRCTGTERRGHVGR
jgi:hypothetical protein